MADNPCPGWDPTNPHGIRLAMLTTVTEATFYGEHPLILESHTYAEYDTAGIFTCLMIMSTYILAFVFSINLS